MICCSAWRWGIENSVYGEEKCPVTPNIRNYSESKITVGRQKFSRLWPCVSQKAKQTNERTIGWCLMMFVWPVCKRWSTVVVMEMQVLAFCCSQFALHTLVPVPKPLPVDSRSLERKITFRCFCLIPCSLLGQLKLHKFRHMQSINNANEENNKIKLEIVWVASRADVSESREREQLHLQFTLKLFRSFNIYLFSVFRLITMDPRWVVVGAGTQCF